MKTKTIKNIMMLVLPVFVCAGGIRAQTQSANAPAPRLVAPLLIPSPSAAPDSGAPGAVSVSEPQVKNQESRPLPEGPAMRVSYPARDNAALLLGDGLDQSMGELRLQAGSGTKAAAQTEAARPSAAAARNAEMVMRMRMAVEQIAAEYGNPLFAQIFTNDSVQAQVLRKRVQLLQRAEEIRAEIAGLEKQKLEAAGELEISRRQLVALQEQADALTNRLQKAHVLLGMRN